MMKRPLTEAANQLTESEEKKQILKLIELFSDELDKTEPYICRMPVQTYQQFLRFCDISDKYKFLTNFENMVQVLEAQTTAQTKENIELKNQIEYFKSVIINKDENINYQKAMNDLMSSEIDIYIQNLYSPMPKEKSKEIRKYYKLNIRKVSEKTGICISTISRFENGKDISLSSYIILRNFYLTLTNTKTH